MIAFFKKNKIVLLIVFAFSFIFWAQRLFVYTVGYDTAQFLYSSGSIYDEWLSKDRFMLVALKKLFPFILEGSLLRIKIITFICSYIYTVFFMYFLNLIFTKRTELADAKEIGKSRASDKGENSKEDNKGLFGKSNKIKLLLAGMLFSVSPMFLEHYYFTLQSAEISFAFILITITFILSWKLMKSDSRKVKVLCFIFSALIIFFTTSMYQYFAIMYILGVLMCLIKNDSADAKENLKYIFTFIVILAIGVGLFYVVNKYVIWYFGIGRSGYVGNCWLDRPIKESLIVVYQAFAFTLRGLGPNYDLSWTIALIYLFLRIFRGRKTKGNGKRRSDKKKIGWRLLFFFGLFITPYALVLLVANPILPRTAMAITYAVVFIFYMGMEDEKVLRFINVAKASNKDEIKEFEVKEGKELGREEEKAVEDSKEKGRGNAVKVSLIMTLLTAFYVVYQFAICQVMLYGENKRYANDLKIVEDVYEKTGADENTVLVFVGLETTQENIKVLEGGQLGGSFFDWRLTDDTVDQWAVYRFFMATGHPYTLPSLDYQYSVIDRFENGEFTIEYPDDGYITEDDGAYIINFGY